MWCLNAVISHVSFDYLLEDMRFWKRLQSHPEKSSAVPHRRFVTTPKQSG